MSRLFLVVLLSLSSCAGVHVSVPVGPLDVGVGTHTGAPVQETGSYGRGEEEDLFIEREN